MNAHSNAPTFSIVIPVYNAYETLPSTIASVLHQTDPNWELILVDDGSTDGSLNLMLSFASDDDRIRAVSQSNAGPSAARNLGAGLARGEFLAFLDADDFWAPDKLATHYDFHQTHLGVDASFARIEFLEPTVSGFGTSSTLSTVPTGPLALPQIIAENPVCTTSNLVIRTVAFAELGGFASGMVHAEDQEFVARYVDQGHLISGLDQTLVQYRMMDSGLSADLEAMFEGWKSLAGAYSNRLDIDAAEAIYCRYLARRALRTGAASDVALSYMIAGLRLDALSFLADRRRGWMTVLGTLFSLIMPRPMRRRVFA